MERTDHLIYASLYQRKRLKYFPHQLNLYTFLFLSLTFKISYLFKLYILIKPSNINNGLSIISCLISGFIILASPPVVTISKSSLTSALIISIKPSTCAAVPYVTPDCIHSIVLLPKTFLGTKISIFGSNAVLPNKALIETSTPGVIITPVMALFLRQMYLVAVPRSIIKYDLLF